MSSQIKRSYLNLYDKETLVNEFSIQSELSAVQFKGTVPVVIHPALSLKHTSGDFDDVATKLHSIDADVIVASTASAAATSIVQSNLDSSVSSLNSTIGTLQSGLTNEIAQRQSGQTADATARATLESDFTALIAAEAATARSSEQANATSISDLTISTASNLAIEVSTRANAISAIQSQVDFISSNIDPASVDSITELLAKMGQDDGSLLSTITSLQQQVSTLQQIVDQLTNSPSIYQLNDTMTMNDTENMTQITSEDTFVGLTTVHYRISEGLVFYDTLNNGVSDWYSTESVFNSWQ